ncbi:valine--tRNA ligase [Candidatus Pacearchaeota archaeon]|nr:valine--tRNA ligase [Candidatus Pacearchaeota archaeon]
MAEYDFKKVEKKWLDFWEKEKIYKFKPGKKVYSIDMPPPTLSGKMHVGHSFSYSQQDFIARFYRMFNGNVFYPFGTDDNGLPTERLVEKLKNVKSKEMSRTDFIELCLKTLKEIRPGFAQDWKNLGISCDYDIYYSTIDDNSRRISQKHFLDLLKGGLAYKKDFPTIWCPECQTSIAQAELEDKELPSQFSTIKFKVGKEDLLIATTRPELLQACVAVFANPKDKRYKKVIGKSAIVPLFGHSVPIMTDDSASIDKGTGAMMVCSYGDKYDVEAIEKHKLTPKIIFNKDGTISVGDYRGMKIKAARNAVLADMEEKGLVKNKKEIKHAVNVHDKCGTEVEFLPTSQWFIKILDKKDIWIEQGKKIKWHPEFMLKRYENWVNGLEWDWNISRERHFGVPIPVWECKKCKEIIAADDGELPVDPLKKKKKCPKCNSDCTPEEKVLDTWATSSLTPQIINSLVGNKLRFPLSVRQQAHEIIRTWTFYTVVRSYLHEGKLPWENAMISGFVTLEGEKMSKSKGNVIDPREVMGKYGSDALRFAAASSKLGEDTDYQEKDIVTGKKFINKLLNASRFVFMNLKDYNGKKPKKLEKIDEMFLEELEIFVENVTRAFLEYEYFKAKYEVENLFWKTFCDNYLEIVKKRVYNGKGDKKISAQYTLYRSLFIILKLIAPIMPFITEEIYQEHFRKFEKDKSIHVSSWPEIDKGKAKIIDVYLFENVVELLSMIRQEKTNAKKAMNAECILTIPKADLEKIKEIEGDIRDVVNAKKINTGKFNVEFV